MTCPSSSSGSKPTGNNVQHRDPRYRGRRAAPPKRKPGHLRTNYTDWDDPFQMWADLQTVSSVWPEEVRRRDRQLAKRQSLKSTAIIALILMVPVTAIAVWGVVDGDIPWWMIPASQSVALLYFGFTFIFSNIKHPDGDLDFEQLLYLEADRRGIKHDSKTPKYALMNKINADYNSHLWNRNFKWK